MQYMHIMKWNAGSARAPFNPIIIFWHKQTILKFNPFITNFIYWKDVYNKYFSWSCAIKFKEPQFYLLYLSNHSVSNPNKPLSKTTITYINTPKPKWIKTFHEPFLEYTHLDSAHQKTIFVVHHIYIYIYIYIYDMMCATCLSMHLQWVKREVLEVWEGGVIQNSE